MICPICGNAEVGDSCLRCGTDLRALAGVDGDVRLEVAVIESRAPERHLRKPAD